MSLQVHSSRKEKEKAQKDATIRWIANTFQTLSIVEDPYYRALIRLHNPLAAKLTKRSVAEELVALRGNILATILEQVNGQCATFTILDHWSLVAKENCTGLE